MPMIMATMRIIVITRLIFLRDDGMERSLRPFLKSLTIELKALSEPLAEDWELML